MSDIIGSVTDSDVSATPPPAAAAVATTTPSSGIIGHVSDPGVETTEDHYSTTGQQVITALEGAGKGLLGPIAPALERAVGVKSEDIRGRENTNKFIHGASEASTFLGSLLIPGAGEANLAGLVGRAGEGAAALSKIGEASTVAKIATSGVKAGAELAALKTSDELSKLVEQDPSQTLGTAAINIGLSGLIGGIGGAALGAVSPLWNKATNILGVDKLATDFMAETKSLSEKIAPEIAVNQELKSRLLETDELMANAARVNPEVLSESVSKKTYKNLLEASDEVRGLESVNLANKEDKKIVEKYLNATGEFADAVAKGHIENELPVPDFARLNPTPALNRALNVDASAGTKLAQILNDKGAKLLSRAIGETSSGTVGGLFGALVGHPGIGAIAGERVLGPIFSTLAEPLAEKAVNSTALRSSIDYLGQVLSGQKILTDATSNLFKKGTEVFAKDLVPDQSSRDRLEKSIASFAEPDNALKVGGQIGHYLPNQATAAAAIAATSVNYLNSIKPKEVKTSPLDKPRAVSPGAQMQYNRQLDIAQQPLMVLRHIKDGTLQLQDVKTLNTIHPGLHSAMINLITGELIQNKGHEIPYHQRVALNTFIGGAPLDSTMLPTSAQAIIHSQGPQQAAQQIAKQGGGGHKASGSELNQINKTNALFATKEQSRAIRGARQ